MPTERPDNQTIRIRFLIAAARVCSLAVCVGIVVRITVQDRYPAFAAVFYMLSPASIVGSAGLAALLFRVGRNRTSARRMACVALGCHVHVSLPSTIKHNPENGTYSVLERLSRPIRMGFDSAFHP